MHGFLISLAPALFGCSDGAAAGLGPVDPGLESPRPHIVLVVIDTLRVDHLPIYGYEQGDTPFLAELAGRGVVFERAWSSSSWTGPATASILTSVYPIQHGVEQNPRAIDVRDQETGEPSVYNRIPEAIETLPETLRRHGYGTYGISANPCVGVELGFDRGFDRFESRMAIAAQVNSMLSDWSDEIRSRERSFVYLHYIDPHGPYTHRPRWSRVKRGGEGAAGQLVGYDSEISYTDHHLRKAFELLGVDEQTLVIVVSDHGEEFGDHGRRGHGFQLYSELTRALLLVCQPGVTPRAARVERNVTTLDILPTIRDILDLPAGAQDSGQSLTPYYLREEVPAERLLFAMRTSGWGPQAETKQSVVYANEKLIVTLPGEQLELYDLVADPGEQQNLAATRAARAAELRAQLLEFTEGAQRWEGATVDLLLTDESEAALRELGYVGESGE